MGRYTKPNIYMFLFIGLALLETSCLPARGKQSGLVEESSVQASLRRHLYSPDNVRGMDFEVHYDKKSYDAKNIFWMSYFASLQYSHFSLIAKELESLGFGKVGESQLYLRRWYELRLAKISARVQDTDDKWKTEEERQQRLKEVESLYLRDFPKNADLKPKSVADAEQQITGVHDDGRKISFLSGRLYIDATGRTQGSTQLFYAEHRSLPLAVVAFRGTQGGQKLDLLPDFLVSKVAIPAQDGKMSLGFMAAYAEVDAELQDLLKLRESKSPNLRLMVTGHSLGGALATAMSARFMDLQNKGSFPNMRLAGVYTLGSPRIGNDVFAAQYDLWFRQHETPVFRIRNHRDIVTGIPVGLPGTSGFWHVGSLVYYDANGKVHHGDSENGWTAIDTHSDISRSFPISFKDHAVETYAELARKAVIAEDGAKARECPVPCTDKVPMAYFENPKFRTKGLSELTKKYLNTAEK